MERGIAVVGIRAIEHAAGLVPVAAAAGARLVLHLHWMNRVLEGARTPAEAADRVAAFAALLDRLRNRGVAIAWTIHNILPHDAPLPEAEAALRREIVARAAVIHVMARETEDIVRPLVPLPPDRVLRVPQPSFQGVYPGWVGRTEARRLLRIPPAAPVFGLFGALKSYKGLDDLLDALPAVATERPDVPPAPRRDPGSRPGDGWAPRPGDR